MTIRPVVLAVDDDRRVLGVYQAILESRYEVLTVPDGRAALDVLQHRTVDVVLLDMMMPGLNGLGVLDALRRLGIETNVVMVSAVNDSETALEALRLGACDYLTKPFALSELERVVRRLTEHGVGGAPTAGRSRALPHALIVGGDPGFRASLAVALRTRGRVDAVESALVARGVLARTLPCAPRPCRSWSPTRGGPTSRRCSARSSRPSASVTRTCAPSRPPWRP